MATAHLLVTLATIAANAFMAAADLARCRFVLDNSAKVDVPRSWLTPLGLLKAAAAAGLTLALTGVPLVGTAAAAGLVLLFVGAVLTHVRAGDRSLGFPLAYLLLAVATLVLDLLT
jgi:hypothetical protein